MSTSETRKVGELRPTQMMFSFGVGAIVDLPYLSVIVMGLDDWPADPGVAREIHEERLLQAVRWEMGEQVQKLLSPPVIPETAGLPNPFDEPARVGVPVATFPRWMLCPQCRLLAPLSSGLFELKHNPYHPDRTWHVHTNCPKARKPPTVVPARFLVACENGHLDDFPWVEFVHEGPTHCGAILKLIEYGPSGEARDLEVRCETCGKRRRLSEAFGESGRRTMPACRGRRPHLRDYDSKRCERQVRAILIGASNLWFPDVLTTLAIPAGSGRLAQLVADHWATLKHVRGVEFVQFMRDTGQLGPFHGYADDEIWLAIQQQREREESGAGADPLDLKGPEWEILTHPDASPSTDDFRLRAVDAPAGFENVIERVVLVERLREVRALVGFTRIDAPGEFGESPDAAAGRRMQISRQPPPWVPAAEVRGEGIFVQFREPAIQQWLRRGAVQARQAQFFESHRRWRETRFIDAPEANYPGLRYVLLHSFSHALMRQLVLECGYTAASVRERIYSRNPEATPDDSEPMAGVLIYTAAPDSEGTLGGLVSLGEPDELWRHAVAALQSARLCASDPLCAEHLPSQRGITLHAAACHACMFAPETSCERGNKYLDRSVLVDTVERDDLAFFPAEV
jgi:hypothetical protein